MNASFIKGVDDQMYCMLEQHEFRIISPETRSHHELHLLYMLRGKWNKCIRYTCRLSQIAAYVKTASHFQVDHNTSL